MTALPTTALTTAELGALLRFRFFEYLRVGFIDEQQVRSHGLDSERPNIIAPDDVHIVAGDPRTGQILCYTTIEAPPHAPSGTRMRDSARELFPVELVHGRGVYDRLPILPDLPVANVREVGRFVRSHAPGTSREALARAVVEIGVALFRTVIGPLRSEIDGVIGDLELGVAKHNLDFFHVPATLLHDTVPLSGADSYLGPRYQDHDVHPFAVYVSDVTAALPRLHAVESALELPGPHALGALAALATDARPAPSSLTPADGCRCTPSPVRQRETPMEQRRLWRERAQMLQGVEALAGLSLAEATRLAGELESVHVTAGDVVARRGAPAQLLVVEEGELARVWDADADQPATLSVVHRGGCCGHEGMLTSGRHYTDIVATTDAAVLRLRDATYTTHLAHLPDVALSLTRSALQQVVTLDRSTQPKHPGPSEEAAR